MLWEQSRSHTAVEVVRAFHSQLLWGEEPSRGSGAGRTAGAQGRAGGRQWAKSAEGKQQGEVRTCQGSRSARVRRADATGKAFSLSPLRAPQAPPGRTQVQVKGSSRRGSSAWREFSQGVLASALAGG